MRNAGKLSMCVAVFAASLLVACGGRHEAAETYILVATNTAIPYWKEAAQGLQAATRELGVKWEMAGPETYDPKAEKEEFLRLVARPQKPAGILVSAADPNLMQDAIDTAVSAGIPVVTIDSDSPKSKRLTFIGTNNYEAGQTAAEVLVSALKGKGNIVVYTMPGQANLDERLEGYKRVLARNAGMKIVHVVDMAGDPKRAYDATEELAKKGAPDAFVCLEALSCAEVADVLDRASIRDKTVIAMDTMEGTVNWMKKGMIRATIAQRPWTMAYFGVRMLDSFHHNKPSTDMSSSHAVAPNFVDTGATLVDKSNVAMVAAPAGTGR